jgi:hypothetical protein
MTMQGVQAFWQPGVERKTGAVTISFAPTATWERQARGGAINKLVMRVAPIAALTMLGACQPDRSAELANATAQIEKLKQDLAMERANAAKLRADAAVADYERSAGLRDKPKQSVAAAEPVAEAKPAAAMCYKDYCPCDPPQEGMDSILCDQLEAGVPVDVQLMIAGRGGREYRRQMAAGDY